MEPALADRLVDLLLSASHQLGYILGTGPRGSDRLDAGAKFGLGRLVTRLTDRVLTVALDLRFDIGHELTRVVGPWVVHCCRNRVAVRLI